MTAARNPDSIEAITTQWLADVLNGDDGRVVGSTVLQVIHGTATKIQTRVEFETGGGQRLSRNVWVKTGLEAHSHKIGQEEVYAGEVYYYRNLAGKFRTNSPRCYYANFEPDTGRSVVIMEDLLDHGAVFSDPVKPLSADFVARALSAIATYQATSWMKPDLLGDKHLSAGGVLRSGAIEDWIFAPSNWAEQSERSRFGFVPAAMRDKDYFQRAYHSVLFDWWTAGPLCLSHGDAHAGQSYCLPDGEVRLLDWQCCMAATWGHDFSYFLTTSMAPDDRRSCEGDLLKGHLDQLRSLGVDTPDMDLAWTIYRACAFYSSAWALCKVEMQGEENCSAITERAMAAVVDLNSLEVIEAGVPTALKR